MHRPSIKKSGGNPPLASVQQKETKNKIDSDLKSKYWDPHTELDTLISTRLDNH